MDEQHMTFRRPRNPARSVSQNPDTDPNPARPKPTISDKKKNFTSATFRGLGCTASSQVSVPAAIRSSANWETKKLKKKRVHKAKKGNRDQVLPGVDAPSGVSSSGNGNNNNNTSSSSSSSSSSQSSSSISLALSSSCVGVPDVWCGPGMGLITDASSVDCVVSARPARGKVDGLDRIVVAQRERSYTSVRRMVIPEDNPFIESDNAMGLTRIRSESRHNRHVRHGFREGLAEIVMLQSSLLMGGRSDGLDRYRDLRLDVDNMSYEELLELGDRIGYVSTGLREDEINRCLRRTKLAMFEDLSLHFSSETERKCSICQEEYDREDETGTLNCGHFYHMYCIKQWLGHKNACPICKTAAVSQT